MNAGPDSQSSSNIEVHIEPDSVKADYPPEHNDLDAGITSEIFLSVIPNLSSDPGMWTELSQSDIDYWVAKGPANCRNRKDNFKSSQRLRDPNHPNENRYRFFQRSLFFGRQANGEKYFRNWLLYSPSKGNVYCFCCKLFGTALHKSHFSTDGFCDWKNATISIRLHESSNEHHLAMIAYLARSSNHDRVDSQLQQQTDREADYWRSVLLRIVEVIKFLAERGLAFRGDDEIIGSPNNGNFLGILELISKFDPFLADHISRFGNRGRGIPNYLSSTIM